MKVIEINQLPSPFAINLSVFLSSFKKKKSASELPQVMYVRPKVRIDAKKVAKYASVCGFADVQGVPMLFPHMEAFPLAMLMFAEKSFPWAGMGMVHLANRAKQYQHIHVNDELRIEMQTGELYAHNKGQVITLHARALRQGVLVWDSTWTLLSMAVKQPMGPSYTSALEEVPHLANQAEILAYSGLGRRYGAASGDVNPIHLTNFTAKLLGFKQAIAHGMWTKARALAILMPKKPVEQAEVSVEFKNPLFLPSRVALWSAVEDQGAKFEVRSAKGDKVHLRGQLSYV